MRIVCKRRVTNQQMDIADAQSHVSYLLYVVAVDIGLHRKILPEVHPLRSDLQGQPLLGTTSITAPLPNLDHLPIF